MSQLQHSQSSSRDRGVVHCLKCNAPIYIGKPSSVAVEFSVPCPKCGHRGMYFKRMMHSENEPADRRQASRE